MDKKQIAAVSAVMLFLKQESSKRGQERSRPSPYTLTARWAACGRQTIMHLRNRVQRGVHGSHMPPAFIGKPVSGGGVLLHRIKGIIINTSRINPQTRQKGSKKAAGLPQAGGR